MLIELIASAVAAAILARIFPRFDAAFAWLLGIVLAYVAGTRTGGFDYEGYVIIIDTVRALEGEEFLLRVAAVRDPLFVFFIDMAAWLSDDAQAVFVLVAAVSVASKVYATAGMHGRRTLFMAIYAVFLAPGLEFAAIRAALAIGLLMVAFEQVRRWRYVWFLLGIAGHASVIVAALGSIFRSGISPRKIVAIFGITLLFLYLNRFIPLEDRLEQYLENRGTIYALSWPTFTLGVLWLISRANRSDAIAKTPLVSRAYASSFTCILLSIALAIPFVTVSFRILEIAWVLMLAQLVSPPTVGRQQGLHLVAGCAWATLLLMFAYVNVYRDTWLMMLDPTEVG